ncbi:MAG: segregation/condensation protein A [Candidatus Jordarchaeales archaeon]
MVKQKNKPFWLDPPWSILIDPSKASDDPWSVNVAELIIGFLEKMREMECFNYWVSGKALLSASIIHRLKTEILLQLAYMKDSKKEEERENVGKFDIPPIPMPFRITSRKVSLAELLFALQQALLTEQKRSTRVKTREAASVVEEVEPEEVVLDALHEEWDVEAKANEVYSKVVSLGQEIVTFSSLVGGSKANREIIIETFLALLFLSIRGAVYIWQEKPGGEIYIMEGEKWRKMLRQ